MTEKELLARYRRMRAWVERERKRRRPEERRDQRYLRRTRLVCEIDAVTLRELLVELREFRT